MVAFCRTDPDLMTGIYMISCRALAKQQLKARRQNEADMYEQRALYYRGECIRLLYEAMPGDSRPLTDNIICVTVFLAFSEVRT